MLLVTAIGYRPVEVTVEPTAPDPLVIELDPMAATLPELGVAERKQLVTGSDNTWVVDRSVAREVPASVEPDLFRALALSPAVSFSSIRSSRPLVRGVDADDLTFTIDGHEVVNLYHIGRSFSAFPSLLAEEIRVRTQPATVDMGRTTSGRIDISGAEWAPGRRSELQYGIGAWSGLAGWQGDAVSAVVGLRTFEGSMAAAVAPEESGSLAIRDFYSRLDVRRLIPLRLSFFHSSDRGADTDPRQGDLATLDWGTWLVGARSDLVQLPWLGLGLSAAYSSRTERGDDVPARRTTLTVDNTVARVGGRVDGRLRIRDGVATIWFGGEAAGRRVENRITPGDSTRFPGILLDRTAMESGGYLDLETRFAGAVLRTGIRIDALDQAEAWQPRLSLALPLGTNLRASLAAGRAARLLHLLSDAGKDPKIGYYDIWLLGGTAGVPVAMSSNISADVGWNDEQSSARLGVFGARGEGQLDLLPSMPRTRSVSHWRSGRSRIWGMELEASTRSDNERWFARMSYTLARSDRDWGEGWVPWTNDRRHQLRLSGSLRPFGRTTFSPSLEAASGQPYTPFVGVEALERGYREVYGSENSARGEMGIRFGVAVEQGLRGPFDSDVAIGVSVTNFGFGDQGPREHEIGFIPVSEGGPPLGAVPASRQVSELPVIPSLLLRVKF